MDDGIFPPAPNSLAIDCILTFTTSIGLAKNIEKHPVIAAAAIFLVRGGSSPGFKLGQMAFLTCSYKPNLTEQLTNCLYNPGVRPLNRLMTPSSEAIFVIA